MSRCDPGADPDLEPNAHYSKSKVMAAKNHVEGPLDNLVSAYKSKEALVLVPGHPDLAGSVEQAWGGLGGSPEEQKKHTMGHLTPRKCAWVTVSQSPPRSPPQGLA